MNSLKYETRYIKRHVPKMMYNKDEQLQWSFIINLGFTNVCVHILQSILQICSIIISLNQT